MRHARFWPEHTRADFSESDGHVAERKRTSGRERDAEESNIADTVYRRYVPVSPRQSNANFRTKRARGK